MSWLSETFPCYPRAEFCRINAGIYQIFRRLPNNYPITNMQVILEISLRGMSHLFSNRSAIFWYIFHLGFSLECWVKNCWLLWLFWPWITLLFHPTFQWESCTGILLILENQQVKFLSGTCRVLLAYVSWDNRRETFGMYMAQTVFKGPWCMIGKLRAD